MRFERPTAKTPKHAVLTLPDALMAHAKVIRDRSEGFASQTTPQYLDVALNRRTIRIRGFKVRQTLGDEFGPVIKPSLEIARGGGFGEPTHKG